jgi:protein-S-isoprenylcysteine O-methyltransferase Ste14
VAEQTATDALTGTVGNTGAQGLDARIGESQHHATHHGSRSSWIAVSIIVVGFVVGGVAMVTSSPTWWLFWTGVGIVVIGGIMALSSNILDDWY